MAQDQNIDIEALAEAAQSARDGLAVAVEAASTALDDLLAALDIQPDDDEEPKPRSTSADGAAEAAKRFAK